MESNWGRRFKSITSALTLAAMTTAQVPAFAQGAGVSEQLYRQGQELMKSGNVHDACAKFDASYRADQTAVGSLTALAACHEKEGKIASAWGEYTTVATIAQRNGEADRQAFANEHAKQLEPKLHHVILKVDAATTAAPGLAVTLDGLPFTSGAFNSSVPIDSGPHTLSVTAPDKKSFEKKFASAADAGTDTVDVPALADAPKAVQAPVYTTPEDHSTHWNKTKLTVGIILGVVGLGGVGTAIGLGINAGSLNQKYLTLHSEAQQCASPTGQCLDDAGHNITDPTTRTNVSNSHESFSKQNHDAASTSQTIAIVSGIAGGLLLVGGAFFIITAPESKKSTPSPDSGAGKVSNLRLAPVVGPQFNGLGLSGAF